MKKLTLIAVYILSTSIIPAYADNNESDFVYLDCDLYRAGKDEQSSYSFKIHYRLNQVTNDLEVYQTTNVYSTVCDTSECYVNDSELKVEYKSDTFFMNRNINRQTGAYFESIIEQKPGQNRTVTLTTGSCERGRSRISTRKKF